MLQVVNVVNKTIYEQTLLYALEMDVRVILCIMRSLPQTAMETVKFAAQNGIYKHKKMIVGIDLAGNEILATKKDGKIAEA